MSGLNEADDEFCALSERVDGQKHSWAFDGDDPYIACYYCGQIRDALSGRIIRLASPADTASGGAE